jgi:pimeloyl-ACP methyl ester carboxylesterase
MQSLLTTETPEGVRARGWLHRAQSGSDTCIVIIHGHNNNGSRGRFITLAKWLEHHGYDAMRWDCIRPEIGEKCFAVLPVTAEIAQVRALLHKLRPQYRRLVLAGHSQGGLIALSLAAEGWGDALVQMMPVIDVQENVQKKFAYIGFNIEELRRIGSTTTTYPNGESFTYDAAFFEDLATFNAKTFYEQYTKPLLVVGGTRDEPVPLSEIEKGFSWANEPKELFIIEDVHNFNDESAVRIATRMNEWLRHKN